MSLSIKILDCHGYCKSCYETDIRKCNPNLKYNINKILKSLKDNIDNQSQVTVHGGEPLRMKTEDLEKIFKIVFKKFKRTGIQTGLIGLTDKHIELFKKYKTHVGVSLDGMDVLSNTGRLNGIDMTLKYKIKVINNIMGSIKKLKSNSIRMSIIALIRKYNKKSIINFIDYMASKFDIMDFRTNVAIVFDKEQAKEEQLNNDEYFEILKQLYYLTVSNNNYVIQPIRDIIDKVFGHGDGTCTFGECDPFFTTAEITINENGEFGNCLKNLGATDGLDTNRTIRYNNVRYKILPQIDEDNGGCMDCKFWDVCKGGCPGAGINNDWRNRTRFCEGLKSFYQWVEDKLKGIFPNLQTLHHQSHKSISKSTWQINKRIDLTSQIVTSSNNNGHKDHGDIPHGDHTDKLNPVRR